MRNKRRPGLSVALPVPLGARVWAVHRNPACHPGVQDAETFLFGRVVTPRYLVEPVAFALPMLDAWGDTVFATEAEGRAAAQREEERQHGWAE